MSGAADARVEPERRPAARRRDRHRRAARARPSAAPESPSDASARWRRSAGAPPRRAPRPPLRPATGRARRRARSRRAAPDRTRRRCVRASALARAEGQRPQRARARQGPSSRQARSTASWFQPLARLRTREGAHRRNSAAAGAASGHLAPYAAGSSNRSPRRELGESGHAFRGLQSRQAQGRAQAAERALLELQRAAVERRRDRRRSTGRGPSRAAIRRAAGRAPTPPRAPSRSRPGPSSSIVATKKKRPASASSAAVAPAWMTTRARAHLPALSSRLPIRSVRSCGFAAKAQAVGRFDDERERAVAIDLLEGAHKPVDHRPRPRSPRRRAPARAAARARSR